MIAIAGAPWTDPWKTTAAVDMRVLLSAGMPRLEAALNGRAASLRAPAQSHNRIMATALDDLRAVSRFQADLEARWILILVAAATSLAARGRAG